MQNLYSQLEEELCQINKNCPIQHSNRAIEICEKYLEQLRQQVLNIGFESGEEEVVFFKKVKPKFLAKLLYYAWVYNLCTHKTEDTTENLRKQYNKALKRIRAFQKRHHTFYRYMKAGDTFLDKKLFTRGNSEMNMYLDPECYCFERNFSTSYDYILAKLLANKSIVIYIKNKLKTRDLRWSILDGQFTLQD